jgi:multiple sugar transport system permease protein
VSAAPTAAFAHVPNERRWRIAAYVVVVLFLVWVLVPIATVFLNSFKPTTSIFTRLPDFNFIPTLEHYRDVLEEGRFPRQLLNSAIVAIGTTILSLLIGTPAAYALARVRFPGQRWWFRAFLLARMVPAVALVVPMFVVLQQTGLKNTYAGLIITHTSFALPLVVWMMHSFFQELPRELEEAAIVDGASRWLAFLLVALPLTLPGLAVTAVLTIFFSWNEFLFALVLTGPATQTMPIGVSSFIGTVSVNWGGSSAAAVLAMAPMFIIGLAIQRFLVRGLAMGAVKG